MQQPLVLAEPERPFWSFGELFLAAAIFCIAIITIIGVATKYLHAPQVSGLWGVIEETAAYAVLFVALKIMFARHGRRLLDSLGWSALGPFQPLPLFGAGIGLSFIVVALQYALLTPNVETPFDQMLDSPASRIAVALFGMTLGPVIEELLFRGFLQPLLTSAIGVFPGIVATSVLFGALHLGQNDFIWQSGVLITLVGFVLGTVRHLTGSTKASTIVHMAYNSLPFLALLINGNPLAQK